VYAARVRSLLGETAPARACVCTTHERDAGRRRAG